MENTLTVFGDAISRRTHEVVNECEMELVTNFDLPAISIIAHHAAVLGMDRDTFELMRIAVQEDDARIMRGEL